MKELLRVEVDPISLAKFRALAEYGLYLQVYLMPAVQQSLEEMKATAEEWMWETFRDPTGPLEDSFVIDVYSLPQGAEGTLENDSPYAWRREKGFSGMTDSLGRYFKRDPGSHYMEYTFGVSVAHARDNVETAVDQALSALGIF